MLPTTIYDFTLTANQTVRLLYSGQLFKILSATAGLRVVSDFGTIDGISTGQGLENTPFDYLTITNKTGAVNIVKLLIGDENFIDGLNGTVVISSGRAPVSAAFVNVNATVTNASAQLFAANAVRQYLLIQNKDGIGSIFVNFGAAATSANGIEIAAGGSFELNGTVSTQQIFAIGSIASNANIVTVEG